MPFFWASWSPKNLQVTMAITLQFFFHQQMQHKVQQTEMNEARIKSATAGRLLIVYLLVRELAAALGLTSLGGHPQMVRPLIVPMAEGAFVNRFGELPKAISNKLRAMSAATDNVGLFFGEDIFVAFGSIILMQTFIKTTANIDVNPLHIALWGIPTAIFAFLIHAYRLYRLDNQLLNMLPPNHIAVNGGKA